MSHIHLPDGSISFVWWCGGFILCFSIIALLVFTISPEGAKKRVPYAGIAAALMLTAMYIPLGVLPIHLSLAVMTGILTGPGLGFITVFVVNVILALMGHGGVTLIGINTLILGSELIIGFYVFKALTKFISTTPASVIAVIIAVIVSASLMFGIAVMTVGIFDVLPLEHNHEHDNHIQNEAAEDEHVNNLNDFKWLLFSGWGAMALILIIGITVESLVTAGIVSFIGKVRPDLINTGANV